MSPISGDVERWYPQEFGRTHVSNLLFPLNILQSALQTPTLKITKKCIAIVILIFQLTASAVLVAFWR